MRVKCVLVSIRADLRALLQAGLEKNHSDPDIQVIGTGNTSMLKTGWASLKGSLKNSPPFRCQVPALKSGVLGWDRQRPRQLVTRSKGLTFRHLFDLH
jgi:hypothetical protein